MNNNRSLAYAKARLAKLQEEVDFREMISSVEFRHGDVVRFAIKYGDRLYNYAALAAYVAKDDLRWFVTGRSQKGQYLSTDSFITAYLTKAEHNSIQRASDWESLFAERAETVLVVGDDKFIIEDGTVTLGVSVIEKILAAIETKLSASFSRLYF